MQNHDTGRHHGLIILGRQTVGLIEHLRRSIKLDIITQSL